VALYFPAIFSICFSERNEQSVRILIFSSYRVGRARPLCADKPPGNPHAERVVSGIIELPLGRNH
jgi:hypothetical protein